MKTFELHHIQDVTGISGTGVIAQGCVFDDGQVCMRWVNEPRTTTVFPSMDVVVHIHGHEGRTKVVWTGNATDRGWMDCVQDYCEGAPFASVGGLSKRAALVVPGYITPAEHAAYLNGYRAMAHNIYGAGWETF